MAPRPEPLEDDAARARWFAEADAETRAANPKYYWAVVEDTGTKFFWEELEVDEAEFRVNAEQWQLDVVGGKPTD